MNSEKNTTSEIPHLSQHLKVLLTLLAQSDLEEDGLIGTFLLLKERASQTELESWIMWLYRKNPSRSQITEMLIDWVKKKDSSRIQN